MFRWLILAIATACKPKAQLVAENPCLRQQRIQGEPANLGFTVCARTVAKYMRKPWEGHPSPGWRQFLEHHAREIWACDPFTVRTIWFRTLYVFFVIHHGTREVIHVRVTAHPTAEWLAQQLAKACDVDREPPRYLIHDRDGCFGAAFNRRVQSLGIVQIRTPVCGELAVTQRQAVDRGHGSVASSEVLLDQERAGVVRTSLILA